MKRGVIVAAERPAADERCSLVVPIAQSMIPKSGNRILEKIMLKRTIRTMIRFN
jgi:hypothetical protein